jgi:DNA-binding CsgD family transcriptional regulator
MGMPGNTAGPVADPWPPAAGDPDVEVLRLLAEGCSNAEISARLGLAPREVKKRTWRVSAGIGHQSIQQQAADYVARHGYELPPADPAWLSEREHQVLALITDGHTNAQIAAALEISPATAKSHTTNIYAKIGAHNRAQAVRWAMSRSETQPTPAG